MNGVGGATNTKEAQSRNTINICIKHRRHTTDGNRVIKHLKGMKTDMDGNMDAL